VSAYEGSVEDILHTLLERGYSRKQEFEADSLGVEFLYRAGYDPGAMLEMLQSLETVKTGVMKGWMKTHPSPGDREKNLKAWCKGLPSPPDEDVELRAQRFSDVLRGED